MKMHAISPKYLLVPLLATYFFFGIQHLSQFVTADERYWVYERIPQYWEAIGRSQWKKTFINDKPGVTLALVSGFGLLFEPHPNRHYYENHERLLIYDTTRTERLYMAFRLPVLIFNGLMLVVLFWIIGRIASPWIALWTTTLIGLSPILLGISQIVNPDALLWSLGAAALLSFVALVKTKERKFLWFSLVFSGFALLTKYVAFILFPFFLLLLLADFYHSADRVDCAIQRFQKHFLSLFAVTGGAFVILCLFLPALVMDSKYASQLVATIPHKPFLFAGLTVTLGILALDTFVLHNHILFSFKSFFDKFVFPLRKTLPVFFLAVFAMLAAGRNLVPDWNLFVRIPFDIKDLSDTRYYGDLPDFFEALLLEWNPIVFSLTPVMLAGFTLLLFFLLRRQSAFPLLATVFLGFVFFYPLAFLFSNIVLSARYAILLYPLLAFLAALGFDALTKQLFRFRLSPLVLTVLIFALSLVSLALSKPFYFNYTNLLLPRDALIHDAWGYGGYEAAQYLNSLPDARQLTVWADYYGVCEFFVGRCLTAYTFDRSLVRPDYYVLTRRGEMRYMSRYTRWERLSGLAAYKYYDVPDPQWRLFIDDRPDNFVKVVEVTGQ